MTGTPSGFTDQDHAADAPARRILTVCTANRCRSPLLAAVLRNRIAAKGLDGRIVVKSTGLLAVEDDPIDPVVLDILERQGWPAGERYAHPITLADIRQADLILAVAEQHRMGVFYRSPENLYKVVLLSELTGDHRDLADPSGLPPALYRRTLAEIERYVDDGWPRLYSLLAL